jgi:hypothetical protein
VKARDFKQPDAPKAEPLKAGLSEFIGPDYWKRLAEQLGIKPDADTKEPTP